MKRYVVNNQENHKQFYEEVKFSKYSCTQLSFLCLFLSSLFSPIIIIIIIIIIVIIFIIIVIIIIIIIIIVSNFLIAAKFSTVRDEHYG